MTATANISITGTITGLPTGTKTFSISISSTAASGHSQQIVLANGDNTITLPTAIAPTGCIIQLPSDNTQACTFKSTGTDAGHKMGKTGAFLLTWDSTSPPTSFVINSAAAQTGKTTQIDFF